MILIIEPSFEKATFWAVPFIKGDFTENSVSITAEEFRNRNNLAETVRKITNGTPLKNISIRILFGGEIFGKIKKIDDSFFIAFDKLAAEHPLFVANLKIFIKLLYDLFPHIPMLAFFETGFFSELPAAEKCYAVPEEFYGNSSSGKWGFHGIWHSYNANILGNTNKTISVVLDNTTTVCALNKNSPVAISFGNTPLEGIMGRKSCGDIDPGIVFYLMKQENYSVHKMDEILKKHSGFYGLTGQDKSLGELIKNVGIDKNIELAFEIYMIQIKRYIGESFAVLGGVSDIIFSGTLVETFIPLIYNILKDISFIDIQLSPLPWESKNNIMNVSNETSKINIYLNKTALFKIIYQMSKDYISKHNEVIV